jgi:hypothetical protein
MAVQQQNHKKRIHGRAESGRGIVSKAKGNLFKEGGEGAGQEEIIDRHDDLTVARAIYRGRVAQYSGRPIMLRDCLRLFGPEIVRHNCGQRSWRGQALDPLV